MVHSAPQTLILSLYFKKKIVHKIMRLIDVISRLSICVTISKINGIFDCLDGNLGWNAYVVRTQKIC